MSDIVKVCFIEQDSGIGGAEVNLFSLIDGLDNAQFHVFVVVPHEGPLTERLNEMNADCRVIPQRKFIPTSTFVFGKKVFNPFAVLYDIFVFVPTIFRLRNLLRNENVDVVHTNSMVAHIYGGIAAKLAKVPCMWHIQDIIDPFMALGLMRKSFDYLARWLPMKIVAVSHAVGKMFTGKSAEKTTVVHNGVDTGKYSPEVDGSSIRKEFDIADDEFVVGMVGRLNEWKGQQEFLKAAAIVSETFHNTRYLIVGDTTFSHQSYKANLQQMAMELGISAKTIFTGARNDVPELMQAMDVMVHSSILPDPCPLVVFEGMASGIPVIAADNGGPAEIIENGKTGLLTDPSREDKLASEIISLLKDRAFRETISAAARKKIIDKYSIQKFIIQMQEAYREVTTKI